jgi:transcriptional regulator GlxA family with amidase domain
LVPRFAIALDNFHTHNGSVRIDLFQAKSDMTEIVVVVLAGANASSVAVTRDMLDCAAQLASRLGEAVPRWRLCSLAGGPVALCGGMSIETERLPQDGAPQQVWLFPGLGLTHAEAIAQRLADDDAVQWAAQLANHVAAGGCVAASCSAVFVLQRAGVLEDRRATTTWWLAPLLQRLAPSTVVCAERMVVDDGPVTTAGAALAQVDLVLHLLRRHAGHRVADAVSRLMLADARQAQAPYVVPAMLASGDALVARLAEQIEQALPDAPSVSALATACCMSERTLSRHVFKATGMRPMALIQAVRLRRARALLETSRMTVEQVAEAVGYQDATALRRMMRKVAGANPSQYRAGRLR